MRFMTIIPTPHANFPVITFVEIMHAMVVPIRLVARVKKSHSLDGDTEQDFSLLVSIKVFIRSIGFLQDKTDSLV